MEDKREAIYDLIDMCGDEQNDSHTVVLKGLIKWLTTDQIVDFVEHFKQQHNIMGYEQYELCMSCQNTYDANNHCACSKNMDMSDESTEDFDEILYEDNEDYYDGWKAKNV